LLPAKYQPFPGLIRTLAESSLSVQIKIQIETHIQTAQALIERFNPELIVRQISCLMCVLAGIKRPFAEKNRNFPKMHQLSHHVRDIRQKGTAGYLGCMVGENSHQGPIKAYQASKKTRDTICQVHIIYPRL
jgi:hypothetical protein